MDDGGGLGGPEREEGPLRPWLDPLLWLEDWEPPCRHTPPPSLEWAPKDLAWEEALPPSREECCHCCSRCSRRSTKLVYGWSSPCLTQISTDWNLGLSLGAGVCRGLGEGCLGGGAEWKEPLG